MEKPLPLIKGVCIVGSMGTKGRALRPALLLLSILGLVVLIAGCGNSSSPNSAATAATTGSTTAAEDSGEPSAQFVKPGEPDQMVEFGHEASASEREVASKVVEKSLKARAAADFATQCQTLSLKGIKQVPGGSSRKDCPKVLREFASPLSETAKARKNTLDGPIDAMRVKGKKGYALYHGNDGKNYAVPVEKEGTWKVASVLTTEI